MGIDTAMRPLDGGRDGGKEALSETLSGLHLPDQQSSRKKGERERVCGVGAVLSSPSRIRH